MILDEASLHLPPAIEKLSLPFEKFCLHKPPAVPELYMVRLDRVLPMASGNKLYKLAGFLSQAHKEGRTQLLSFGGAWSNHIHALAMSAKSVGLGSVGIIRGEQDYRTNPTLLEATAAGMELHFVDRETYRHRYEPDFLFQIQVKFPNALIVPEGGAGNSAISGCRLIPRLVEKSLGMPPDALACACGTGATAAGLMHGISPGQSVLAYPVLDDPTVAHRIRLVCSSCEDLSQSLHITRTGFGRFGRLDHELLLFIQRWLELTGILLDPIYTGKLCRRILWQISSGQLKGIRSIAILHTGGLQGWRGMQQRVLKIDGKEAWDRINQTLASEIALINPLYSTDRNLVKAKND